MSHPSSRRRLPWICPPPWIWVTVAALASAACAPGVRVRGSVSSVSSDCASVDAAPLREAKVTVHCPNRHEPLLEVSTDAQGRFELRRDGILSKACWVEVSAPGHETATYPVGHLCAVEGNVLEGCHGFGVQAELERRAPRPAEDEGDDADAGDDGDEADEDEGDSTED